MDAAVPTHNRFAGFDASGRMTALVAEGLPDWPADGNLTGLADDAIGAMHDAYLATIRDDTAVAAMSMDDVKALGAHVQALRTEAASRFAAAGETHTEPPAPPAPPVVEPAVPELSAEERAAALAALRGELAPADAPAPGSTITASATISRDDLVAIVTAASEASALALKPTIDALGTALTAASGPKVTVHAEPIRPVTARGLGAFRPGNRAPVDTEGKPTTGKLNPRFISTMSVHSGDVQIEPGTRITSLNQLAKAMSSHWSTLGLATGVSNEQVVMARLVHEEMKVPPERDLRGLGVEEKRKKIDAVFARDAVGVDPFTGKEALVASGGLPYPLEPYYGQLVISEDDRPAFQALTPFVADRGGITTVLPPSLATLTAATRPGTFNDGVTATSTSLTSATAAFASSDVGKPVVDNGSGVIPTGTLINSVTSATVVVLSQATTGSSPSVSFYLPARNPNNLGNAVTVVSAAQDATGTSLKYTYDVQAGPQVSYAVYGIATSLQYANLTAMVNPESVEANIKLAAALAARVADTQVLDALTTYATLLTGAQTFGTARQLLGQIGHEAAFMRNLHRMDPEAIVMVGLPAWAINNMRQDFFNTVLHIAAPDWALTDDEIAGWFAVNKIVPWYYWDGPTDVSQLFTTTGIAAASGTVSGSTWTAGTPMAIPDYPGTGATTSFRTQVVTYMWAPGAVLGLTTGELNVGLVRDSILLAQNRFRSFNEQWETPAFVGPLGSLFRCVHTVAANGSYASSATVTLGVGSGL